MATRLTRARLALLLAGVAVQAQTSPQTHVPPPSQVVPHPVYPLPPPIPPPVTPPNGQSMPPRAADTLTDKATRCLHYATSIGVPAEEMDDYMKRCTQQ
jgi:hypothetical protein